MTTHPLPARDHDVPAQHRATPPEHGAVPIPPPCSPPFDALLIPAVHDLVDEFVQAAREVTGGAALPRLRSEEFLDAEPAVQLAVLLIAAEASVIADPHMVVRALQRQVGHDIHGGDRLTWRRLGLQYTRNAALVAERQTEHRAVADQPRPHDVAPTPHLERQDPAA